MFSRNRELRTFCLALVALAAALAVAALSLGGRTAALMVLATAAALGSAFLLFTYGRYRAIGRLAARLDERLHGDRDLRLGDAREGELAILANEMDKLLQRLAVTAEQLDSERSLLSDSLADISHQLKTPLTSLSIMTELVRRRIAERGGALGADDVADLIEKLRSMERLQERVTWLVAALLRLARVDAGAIRLERVRVDAGELVRRAAEPLAIAFDIAGVSLDVGIQERAGYEGDLSWSVEALQNVLKNSLEHTPAGGSVSVRVSEDALACRIEVTDTGPGIDEGDLPHIFERFYRGADARGSGDADPAGVGIGLALARSLVNAQDGRISARNVLGPGGEVAGASFEIAFFKSVV